jgi:hypothetical protein
MSPTNDAKITMVAGREDTQFNVGPEPLFFVLFLMFTIIKGEGRKAMQKIPPWTKNLCRTLIQKCVQEEIVISDINDTLE